MSIFAFSEAVLLPPAKPISTAPTMRRVPFPLNLVPGAFAFPTKSMETPGTLRMLAYPLMR